MAIPKFPELEEQVLRDWKERQIFKKTLAKTSPKGRFVFYDGPPTANGMPHIGHVETRAFKDIIPRFKTMQGYSVERKAGWDTQGLPVELEVEKDLGLSGKKDIEQYGIERFNAKAKESVWKYKALWEQMTERVGFWLDTDRPYITYEPEYIESLWWIFRQVWDQKLLVQDYKVVPYCPRCGTALSSHEVAQGYQNVEEDSVFVKFKLKPDQKILKMVTDDNTYVIAWTTTPWTLPGNVALAVDDGIEYALVRDVQKNETYIVSDKYSFEIAKSQPETLQRIDLGDVLYGSDLRTLEYEPLFDFVNLEKESGKKAYYIAAANFVTTEDGTGIVHTAVMYGVEDFELGQKLGLPKVHTVDETGRFNSLVKPWTGWKVKDLDKAVEGKTTKAILDHLRQEKKLFKVEKYKHDYPFCWRCKHPLLYYAKTSWFIQMSKLRDQLIANNEQITWYPAHVKEGRFGEWLREVKDWAISRERYWGTPIPIWQCDACRHQECLGSYDELLKKLPSRNRYIFIRHGESVINTQRVLNTVLDNKDLSPLTDLGREQSETAAKTLKSETVDAVFSSPFRRARETAEIIAKELGLKVKLEPRLKEFSIGPELEGKSLDEYHALFPTFDRRMRLTKAPPGGETWLEMRRRMFDLLHELDRKHEGKTFILVTHGDPLHVVRWATQLLPPAAIETMEYSPTAKPYEVHFPASLFQPDGSFDPHRPFIDGVTWPCPQCKQGTMKRIPEVADAWFDSGAMPFAQWHYPFEHQEKIDQGEAYPADYISEAIDQTRGWFYTLLAVATLLKKKEPPYRNVIVLGHINDAKGKKLSKSLGNYVDPMELIDRYGADALRWFLYTANQPWDPKNFDPKLVDEGVKKTFLILMNVVSFWQLYRNTPAADVHDATHPLDRWILAEVKALSAEVTQRLERYDITGAARAIAAFITDLSTWYIRRSRDRFKGDQAPLARAALTNVLLTLAKLMAPFTPFLAEHVYRTVGGTMESVHMEEWPAASEIDERLREDMRTARRVVEQGHALRAKAGLKVRQPLAQVVTLEQLRPDLDDIVREELNVKELHWADTLPTSHDWLATDRVALDTTVTDELREEGMLRDLVREVNALRKTAKLVPSDTIILYIPAQTAVARLVERYAQNVLRDVRAKAATPALDGATHTAEIEFDGQTFTIGLAKS